LGHGTCSYIRMYINAVADSVMLCLQHDFYNIIFKIKQITRSLRGNLPLPPPPPQRTILGAHLRLHRRTKLHGISSHKAVMSALPFTCSTPSSHRGRSLRPTIRCVTRVYCNAAVWPTATTTCGSYNRPFSHASELLT
jgi:hypothetical protein